MDSEMMMLSKNFCGPPLHLPFYKLHMPWKNGENFLVTFLTEFLSWKKLWTEKISTFQCVRKLVDVVVLRCCLIKTDHDVLKVVPTWLWLWRPLEGKVVGCVCVHHCKKAEKYNSDAHIWHLFFWYNSNRYYGKGKRKSLFLHLESESF